MTVPLKSPIKLKNNFCLMCFFIVWNFRISDSCKRKYNKLSGNLWQYLVIRKVLTVVTKKCEFYQDHTVIMTIVGIGRFYKNVVYSKVH